MQLPATVATARSPIPVSYTHLFDVAEIAPLLCPQSRIRQGGLDEWVAEFGLQVHQRHNASADALVTAELALMLFSKARRQGIDSLCELERQLASRRRRQHAM